MEHPTLAYCLLSSRLSGKFITSDEFLNSQSTENSVVYLEILTVEQVFPLLNSISPPMAIIAAAGSLAGHAAGLLNGLSVQVCLVPGQAPPNADSKYVLIDGKLEQLYFSPSPLSISSLPVFDELSPDFDLSGVTLRVDGKNPTELQRGLDNGATGIGILRTEWLGWDSPTPPTLSDHLSLYKACLACIGTHPLVIRLFDIGGDKVPKWAASASDKLRSPLGLRGIRAAKIFHEAFDIQLQAINQIAIDQRVGVVIPMLSGLEEIKQFRDYANSLCPGFLDRVELGAMIETPAAALEIEKIIQLVDFVRIGPGDLTQFTLATLRENISPVDYSASGFNSAVISLVAFVAKTCNQNDKLASFCLDIEPRFSLIKQLVDAGIHTFCLSPQTVAVLNAHLPSNPPPSHQDSIT